MHEVENLGNRLKFQRAICLEKRNPIRAWSESLLESSTQLIELYCRLIDANRTVRRNLNDDCFGRNVWAVPV
jgi:hypothetical protein